MKKKFITVAIGGMVLMATTLIVMNWDVVSRQFETAMLDVDGSDVETAVEHAQLHTDPTYVCPMHSQITDTEASACPICGMNLELRETPQRQSVSMGAQGGSSINETEIVFISAAMVNNLGVRVDHVDKGPVSEEVYASGFVEKVSDAQQQDVNSKVNGRLHELVVKQGQWVEEDDVLLTIDVTSYDEALTNFFAAMENGDIQTALKLRVKLVDMGTSGMVLAGFDDEEVRPRSKYLEILAPFSGEVSWLLSEVDNVEVGTRLVQVTAPALAEVDLRSYSRIARGVKVGHKGALGVAHMPGRTWPGRVVEVVHNRFGFYTTLRFHVEVTPDVLEAGAFAGAYVSAGSAESVLRVPASAVIYDENSSRVIRLAADDSYEVVDVMLGFEGHKWVEIRSGLEAGDHVVTRGQFLIDSEATLQAGFKRLLN